MHLCLAVPEIWVYKMAASGRTEVANDVKYGVRASFIELYLCSKFCDPISYSVQTHTASTTKYAAYPINAFANSVGLGR